MGNIKKNRLGLTLIEIILSIAILGIILVAFMPLFVMPAKTNSKSQTMIESTYIGSDTMELIYSQIQNNSISNFEDLSVHLNEKILDDEKYDKGTKIEDNIYTYEYENSKYIKVEFKEDGNLIGLLVKVYKDKDMNDTEMEVQYESLYIWKESGN